MNGAHDLGGMHGFGRINAEPEAEEPVFHAEWEKRVFGLVRAVGALGRWNSDMARYARERQHPVDYLRHSYYENWLAGLEKLLAETGLVTAEELASGAQKVRSEEWGVRREEKEASLSSSLPTPHSSLSVAEEVAANVARWSAPQKLVQLIW
jgi:hypothetical protein